MLRIASEMFSDAISVACVIDVHDFVTLLFTDESDFPWLLLPVEAFVSRRNFEVDTWYVGCGERGCPEDIPSWSSA